MKTYFSKYLPVEGEIKEGDNYLHEDGNVMKWGKLTGNPEKWKGHQKVKLFLCSRDIQIGDEFKWEDKTLISLGHGDDDDRYWIHAAWLGKKMAFDVTKAYKIVGEISPEAGWVKEGDEFVKEDLGIRRRHTKYDSIPLSNLNMNGHWSSDKVYITVKGPCGHFH